MSLEYVYSAGTISVGNNSTSVTGVGTQWVAAGIREGDDFRANGLVATIASVNSNTSITLKNGWPGSSISSGDYSIRQYDNADRALPAFNNLLLALGSGNLTSLAALTGAANQMPYWTGAGVMAETGLTSEARSLLASTLLSRAGNNLVTVGADTRITGPAVTQAPNDTTPGRVLKVGDFGIGRSGTITITRGSATNGWVQSSPPWSAVALTPAVASAAYAVVVDVISADDMAGVGDVTAYDRATNGFKLRFSGRTDNVELRWSLLGPY